MPDAFDQSGGAKPITLLEKRRPELSGGGGTPGPLGSARHGFVATGQGIFVVKRADLPTAYVGGIEVPCLPDSIKRPTVEGENDRPAEANVVELVLRATFAAYLVTSIAVFHRHLPRGHLHHGLDALAGFLYRHFAIKSVCEFQGFFQRVWPGRGLPRE
jgi:hypothetical protein